MSLVMDVLSGWTKKKQQAAEEKAAARQVALEVFVHAAATDRRLTDAEASQFVGMLEREGLTETEFETAVSARRELLDSKQAVLESLDAFEKAREVQYTHEADLKSRETEDARRKLVDETYESEWGGLRHIAGQREDRRTRLRQALPERQRAWLSSPSPAPIYFDELPQDRAALAKEIDLFESYLLAFKEPTKPTKPVPYADDYKSQYDKSLEWYEGQMQRWQDDKSTLERMRELLAQMK